MRYKYITLSGFARAERIDRRQRVTLPPVGVKLLWLRFTTKRAYLDAEGSFASGDRREDRELSGADFPGAEILRVSVYLNSLFYIHNDSLPFRILVMSSLFSLKRTAIDAITAPLERSLSPA